MSGLNWVDFIILAIFLFSIFGGFVRGFIREIIAFATLIIAIFIAISFSNAFANYLTEIPFIHNFITHISTSTGVNTATPFSYIALGISFAILFSGTMILGSILGYIIGSVFQTGILGFGNRLLGGMFGLVRGYILNLVFIFVVQLTPLGSEAAWHQSRFVQSFQPAVIWLGNIVSPSLANLKDKVGRTLQNVNTQVQGITHY